MKRSLITKDMQIKITKRYHFIPVRMTNRQNSKYWRGYGEKGTPVHCWWDVNWCSHLWRTVCSFLKKLKIKLPYDPAIPPLGISPNRTKTLIWKDICTPCLLQHYLQEPTHPKYIHQWMDESKHTSMCAYMHTGTGILFNHKNKWNLGICNDTDGRWGHYA